jgi:hypothetical protein
MKENQPKAPLLTPQEIVDGNNLDNWIVLIYHEQEQVVPSCTLGEGHNLHVFDSKEDANLAFDPTRGKDPLDDYLPAAVPVADVMDFITAKANGIVIDDEWWFKREGYELHTIGWSTPTWLRTDEAKKEGEDDLPPISLDRATLLTAKEILEGDYLDYFMVWTFHVQDQIGQHCGIAGKGDLYACFENNVDADEYADSLDKILGRHRHTYPVQIAKEIRYLKAIAHGMTEDDYWEIIEREYAFPDHEETETFDPWHVSGAVDDDPEDSSDTLEQDWEANITLRQEEVAKEIQIDD